MRNALAAVLEESGFVVVKAANAEAAAARLLEQSFDLAILDKNLPGQSGIELLRWIRKESPSLAVIVMTAFASPDSIKDTLNLSVDAYLDKPFPDIFEVVDTARSVVAARHATDRARAAGASKRPRVVLVVTPDTIAADALSAPLLGRADLLRSADGQPLGDVPHAAVVDARRFPANLPEVVAGICAWAPGCRVWVVSNDDLPIPVLRALVRARADRLLTLDEYPQEARELIEAPGVMMSPRGR